MRTDPSAPRLLIYSQDGLGLGHLRRTTLLAGEFLAACPEGSVLTISDSPLGQFFSAAAGHDYLKLPSIRKVRAGGLAHRSSLSSPFQDVLELRRETHPQRRGRASNRTWCSWTTCRTARWASSSRRCEALADSRRGWCSGCGTSSTPPPPCGGAGGSRARSRPSSSYFDDVLVYGSQDVFDVAAAVRLARQPPRPAPATAATSAPRRRPAGRRRARSTSPAPGRAGSSSPWREAARTGIELFEALLRAVPMVAAEPPLRRSSSSPGPFLPEAERQRLQRAPPGCRSASCT